MILFLCIRVRLTWAFFDCIALEAVTGGLARATSHRVLSPPKGSTPRYSIPFFQGVAQRVLVKDHLLQCALYDATSGLMMMNIDVDLSVKPEILKLQEGRPLGSVDCK